MDLLPSVTRHPAHLPGRAASGLERQPLDHPVQLALERRFLLLQLRLAVARGGQLLLVLVELPRVSLHLLLLSAHIVQAADIPPDAVFIGRQIANLRLRGLDRPVVRRDCRLLVGDLLQLPLSGVAERLRF